MIMPTAIQTAFVLLIRLLARDEWDKWDERTQETPTVIQLPNMETDGS